MEKNFAEIINEGKKNGESIEVINTKLKEAGANFHLDSDSGVAGWTEDEMRKGFIQTEDDSKDALYKIASDGKPIRFSHKAPGGGVYSTSIPVMDRDKSRAGTVITVDRWELAYDSLGYCYARRYLRK